MPVFRSPVRCVSATKIFEAVAEIKIVISSMVLAQSLTAYSRITWGHPTGPNCIPVYLYVFRVPGIFIRDFRWAPPLIDRPQTKCLRIGLTTSSEKLRILMLET